MLGTLIPLDYRMSLREKARLNICIAKDLSDSFGGRKSDYLKRLNQKLKMKIIDNSHRCARPLSIAA
jgi:hypothetical protein